ncbi:aminotransferase class III-fold pyridoxal phosphate-dependent enzyme [Pseudenhygromyxa sp. WMMC2535]|uniref:aminotransferase family protein n=1 Tax=Pseudenhygromyxa sp. WMMC2535 TaxID=2712867 RepID=UPI00155812C7|nr:aminotransferase class III-fold pyridoxal phosphate-dependent enzyme [Pseudenhygromyxa sp. WMMC2535]NVB37637.1 aminotransferase class III-fold pyridoxal phosphate-dependent enzyme [Pseudenhygromyxa sp. WMMC2535]
MTHDHDHDPASTSLLERQRAHLFFTWSAQRGAKGLEITDAAGARFEVAGKGWVWDLESQVYNVNAGHKHPHIQQRMIAQIQALPACAPAAVLPIRAELGELLAQKTGMAKAFLTTGGSEAVENAIKLARLLTGRTKVITRRNSYHGATLAVLEVAGDMRKQPFTATMRPALHIEDPYPARQAAGEQPSDWLASAEAVIEREGGESIAAILLEGFTGTNGMQHPPADFWPGVRALCDRHGILLIDDEIFSGFGRTGRWFAREHWGVRPDLMTVGKGLSSGYAPLAGVLVSDALAARFDDEVLWCGLTHYAHPISCAAAVGSIEVLEREGLPQNAERVGQVFARRFDEFVERHAHVTGHRGLGLMRALELDRDASELSARAWSLGAYLPQRGPLAFVCPPLCLREHEAEAICELLDRALLELGD